MKKTPFGPETVIELSAGGYTLKILPAVGGQVIGLEKGGVKALHEPESYEAFQKGTTMFGLPILFPPNRIDGGTFTAGGRTYHFPINEPRRGNSLHGFLHTRPWEVESLQESEEEAKVELVFHGDETTDFYPVFPVKFEARQSLTLNEKGLTQWVSITNLDSFPLPVGLGFHSAFTVETGDKILVSVGERIPMTERMLPLEPRPLNEAEAPLRQGGLDPMAWAMDDHYTAKPLELKEGECFHGAKIRKENAVVTYEVDPLYRHWMIWNCFQKGGFICIEPQNWRVNAPNLVESLGEDSGMMLLDPGVTAEALTRLSIEGA